MPQTAKTGLMQHGNATLAYIRAMRIMRETYRENLKIAVSSIRAQALRATLTVLIIGIGLTALVGILTSTEAIDRTIQDNFALLGSNTFTIQSQGMEIRIGRQGMKQKNNPPIPYREAIEFAERSKGIPGVVSLSLGITGTAELSSVSQKTDPNVRVMAGNEFVLITSGLEIESGRSFNASDIEEARPVAIVGQDVADKLFPAGDPLGKTFRFRGKPYQVIGVLASKGNSFGLSSDNQIFIPITNARANFVGSNRTTSINIKTYNVEQQEEAEAQATALMRQVRRLKPLEEDNFNITRSDSLAAILISLTSGAKILGFVIGGITLLGAAIALMNIMLVSVTERTREIGVRKAMGASARLIRLQFLTEAVLLSQLGGLLGVVMGLGVGNLVAALIGGSFVIPWIWMATGLILCFGVGVLSGFYPAAQAAKLDPIEALRHE